MKENVSYSSLMQMINGENPSRVPVSIWNTRGSVGFPNGVLKIKDYYYNPDIKLKTQLLPLELFDDVILIPGVWPDFGVALEASAFGCEVVFKGNNPPVALPFLKSLNEVKYLKQIDPEKSGLMPLALMHYKEMLKNIPQGALKQIAYLDGCSLTTGPLEVASMIVGHSNLYLGFFEFPSVVKELMEIVTDGIIKWLKALEKVSGEVKVLAMIEHLPSQISPDNYIKFGKPYMARIFNEFPNAIHVYHNEDSIAHIAGHVHDIGINIYHFGKTGKLTSKELMQAMKNKIILMGNIDPLKTLLRGDPDLVCEQSKKLIRELSPNLILSSGGGLTSGTPLENLMAMVEAGRTTMLTK